MNIKKRITKILVLLTVLQSVAFAFPPPSHAASQISITGDAKALNTDGYLDFTNENSNVTVNSETGKFTGYVFSDDLGWIEFGTTDNAEGPVYVELSTGYLKGKAYVLNTENYIDFSANGSNVRIEGTTFSGYVFSEDIGWIDFSDTGVNAASGFIDYPIASWGFNEGYGQNANDSSSYEHTGVLGATTGESTDDPSWTQEDLCYSGKCLSFDGGDYVGISSSVTDVKTVSFWVRPKTTTQVFLDLDGGSHSISATSGTITATGFSTIYVNGQRSRTISANAWQHIVATTGTAFDTSSATLGKVSTSYLTGFLDDIRLFATEKSADQVKGLYASKESPKEVTAQFGPDESWISNGLVGYWKLDETSSPSYDSSGNGNSGTWHNSADDSVGKFGNAISLSSSTSDYVSISSSDDLNPTDAVTVALWVKPDDSAKSSWQEFVMKAQSNTVSLRQYNIRPQINTGYLQGGVISEDGTALTTTAENVIVPNDTWSHVAMTYDYIDSTVRLYMNGKLVQTEVEVGGKINTTDGALALGRLGSYSAEYFDGDMDEVRVYNRALSPSEVEKLYSWAPGPVAYWKFDEGSGTGSNAVKDSSGNSNHGTMQSSMTESNWIAGKYGKALDFDGSDDYIDSPYGENIDPTTAPHTFMMWVKWDGVVGLNKIFFSSGMDTDDRMYLGIINYSWDMGIQSSAWGTGTTPATTDWTHVTLVMDGSDASLYINGVFSFSKSYTSYTFNQNIDIGQDATDVGTYNFGGSIDEVKIYNYARTPQQIVEDMNAGHPAPGSPVGSAIGHWKFDEGYGDTAYDSGTGGNNGDLAGSGTTCPTTGACPTWTNEGKFGKALNFDGQYDYVQAPLVSNKTDNFAVSLWVNWSGFIENWQTIFGNGSWSGGDGWFVQVLGSTHTLGLAVTGGGGNYDTGIQLTQGAWQHLVAQRNNSIWEMYLDGKKITDDSHTATPNTPTTYTQIGKPYNLNYAFYGAIDEVQFFEFPLTADQVKLLYNQGSAAVMGSLSTDSSGSPSSSSTDSYCPPGQDSACVGPVAEWKFDEKVGTSAYDTSENNNTGTLTNGPIWMPQGVCKIGACLEFDGSNDYVDMGTGSELNLYNTDFTIEAWVNLDNYNSSHTSEILNRYESVATTDGYEFAVDGETQETGKIKLVHWNNDSFDIAKSDSVLSLDEWHHVVVTYDLSTTTAIIYIDGKNDGTDSSLAAQGDAGTTEADIGIRSNGQTGYEWDGMIDNVRVYKYVRTPAQIAWEYNRGGPVGHWTFDEGAGTSTSTVYDTSGNENNGTLNLWGGGNTATSSARVSGKLNDAIDFDGEDDYITLPAETELDLTKTNPSISMWVKTTSTGILYSDYKSGLTEKLGIYIDTNGKLYSTLRDGGTNLLDTQGVTTINDGDWHQIVFVKTGDTTTSLYVDGRLEATGSNESYINSDLTGGNLPSIGCLKSYDSGYIDGQIDDVKIFNYALTEEQVRNEYNAGSAVYFGP
ncbi:hypothetical protein JXA63_05665 [Candidatus Woesebacteria bacterium]|nr:hypothetical protein [Candidatus Woesebacteria bacterium]